ncbi:MAG: SCO family protein [Methyloligellaceae bacterium]
MRRIVLWTIAWLVALAVLAPELVDSDVAWAAPEGARWGPNYFPNHTVVAQDGKTFRFYDDLIKDKIVVINFIYTSCPDFCSLSTARLAQVLERLGDLVGRDIFVYSISLDPENDTPEALKNFAEAFGAGPGWLFLTGDPKKLHEIRYKLGERSRKLSEHRADLLLGNDRTGEWQRTSMMAHLDLLASNIRDMDPERRKARRARLPAKKRHKKSARGRYKLTSEPGQALFLKACAVCHTIGKGDRVGPDLKDVTVRRERDWLVQFLIEPDVMRAKKDPIALALDAKFKGVRMPNLRLKRNDAEDLIHYLEKQSGHAGQRADADKADASKGDGNQQRDGQGRSDRPTR